MTKTRLAPALLALIWMAAPARLPAQQENPYDVLGKALVPIAGIFAPDDNGNPVPHGLVLDAHLLAASKLPPALQGQPVHLAVMTPDKLLVRAPIAGQILTVCRDGDALWATPGSVINPLLDQLAAAPKKKKKKHDPNASDILDPLVAPVNRKELVFLPVLFQVADQGEETLADPGTANLQIGPTPAARQPCRVLDVQLMPQLEKSLHAEGWTARIWIGADYQILRIALTGPDWSGTVAIDKLELPPELPEANFQPRGADVLMLTPRQFLALMGEVGRK